MAGTPMTLVGGVFTSGCKPVAQALLDLWQCDATGVYDNTGYTLRGHTYTDEQGRFQFETVQPGLYPGRTRHFHVKVQAPNGPILTTQLYFPGEPDNARDGIFNAALLMEIQAADNGIIGGYTFVVQA
jgi:protocatechuate 3,4-dioxygenase beta subunit